MFPSFFQVQLEAKHNVSFRIPQAIASSASSSAATKILALIAEEEGKYQVKLNEAYQEMGEKTFKGLRRALPLTRQKIDWDKVGKLPLKAFRWWADAFQVTGYKLGAELSSSKFGGSS